MVRRITPSQLRSQINQAVNKYNQAVRKYNSDLRKRKQDTRRAVNDYNRAAQRFNAEQRSRQQKIRQALAQLSRQPVVQSYSVIVSSTQSLGQSYLRLEEDIRGGLSPDQERFLIDLPQQETRNSLLALNALTGNASVDVPAGAQLGSTLIETELARISSELDARWRGAVFSLSPNNPDASRHFCTSSREIFTTVLDLTAPDDEVFSADSRCSKTEDGRPTRRAKIHHLLAVKGYDLETLEEFVEKDIENIIELFRVFNDATHGRAGKFQLQELLAIKKRVEDGIIFICGIASPVA